MTDWQIGDLALCVDDSVLRHLGRYWHGEGLRNGEVYTVSAVTSQLNLPHLMFTKRTGPDGSLAGRFRKIIPDKHEPCEAEFVTLLKRAKVKA